MKRTAAHIRVVSLMLVGLACMLPLQAQQYAGAEGFYFNQLYQDYPDFRARHEALERQILQFVDNRVDYRNVDGQVITIPVVIHVVHLPEDSIPTPGTSNPTQDQVLRGLEWLNDAFGDRKLFEGGPYYTDAIRISNVTDSASLPYSVDTKIQFCLARSDDDGNLINGVYRVPSQWTNVNINSLGETSSGYFPQPFLLQNATPTQNTQECLNIWLVNSVCENTPNIGCHIEGFAYPPAWSDSTTDGVVVENTYWGVTPERQAASIFYVGQYLGLFPTYHELTCPETNSPISCKSHGDKVCDTPPDNIPGGPICVGNETEPQNTCDTDIFLQGGPFTSDVQDMITNYMDWGFQEGCHNTFTLGQALRMRAVLGTGAREGLRLSRRCDIPFKNISVIGVESPKLIDCGQRIYPTVVVYNSGNQTVRDIQVAFRDDQGNDTSKRWKNGSLAPGDTLRIEFDRPIEGLRPGLHQGEAYIKLVDLRNADGDPQDDVLPYTFWVLEPGFEVNNFPYCVNLSGGGLLPSWQIVDYDRRVAFEVFNETSCTDIYGNFSLRYNTSGRWADGQGIGADPTGTKDLLVSPVIDLTDQAFTSLSFHFAHKYLDATREATLKILAVGECGEPLAILFNRKGRELETTDSPDNVDLVGWKPESCEDWDSVKVSLHPFTGRKIRLVFAVELESSHSQNLYLDNICLKPQPPCLRPSSIPSAAGEYVADVACRNDSTGWTHYIKSAGQAPITPEDLLLFSILDTGANPIGLQPQDVKMVVTNTYQNGGYDLSGKASYAENIRGWHSMGRYLVIDGPRSTQPVPVKLYFDRVDLEDMRNAIAPNTLSGEENLVFYAIHQNYDNRLEDEHRLISPVNFYEYRHESMPSKRNWKLRRDNRYFEVNLMADQLMVFGGGTGGFGLGMGARYPVMPDGLMGVFQDGQITLDWSTRREWEMSTFTVYRSSDRNFFEAIGETAAAGFSDTDTAYQFNDQAPLEGVNYYYVQLTHNNGVELSSDTIAVFYDPGQTVRVFPNPVQDLLQVNVDAPMGSQVRFVLKNGQNQHIIDTTWEQIGSPGQIDLSYLVPGMYFYTVEFNEVELWGKLVLKAMP